MKRRAPVMGIYTITDTSCGRIYVGSSIDIQERWAEHRRGLRQGRHHSPFLQRSWDAHGVDVFEWLVIEIVHDAENLIAREQWYIDTLKPVFNVSPTAGSQLGFVHSDATKKQMSRAKAKFKNNPTPAQLEYWESLKGQPLSAEHRQAISAAHKVASRPRTAAQLEALKRGPAHNHQKQSKRFLETVAKNLEKARAKRREKLESRRQSPPLAQPSLFGDDDG